VGVATKKKPNRGATKGKRTNPWNKEKLIQTPKSAKSRGTLIRKVCKREKRVPGKGGAEKCARKERPTQQGVRETMPDLGGRQEKEKKTMMSPIKEKGVAGNNLQLW